MSSYNEGNISLSLLYNLGGKGSKKEEESLKLNHKLELEYIESVLVKEVTLERFLSSFVVDI